MDGRNGNNATQVMNGMSRVTCEPFQDDRNPSQESEKISEIRYLTEANKSIEGYQSGGYQDEIQNLYLHNDNHQTSRYSCYKNGRVKLSTNPKVNGHLDINDTKTPFSSIKIEASNLIENPTRNCSNQCYERLNRMRERLFRILSKVPIQVESLKQEATLSTTSKMMIDRDPLLIKYYHERSMRDILDLHFECSLLRHNHQMGIRHLYPYEVQLKTPQMSAPVTMRCQSTLYNSISPTQSRAPSGDVSTNCAQVDNTYYTSQYDKLHPQPRQLDQNYNGWLSEPTTARFEARETTAISWSSQNQQIPPGNANVKLNNDNNSIAITQHRPSTAIAEDDPNEKLHGHLDATSGSGSNKRFRSSLGHQDHQMQTVVSPSSLKSRSSQQLINVQQAHQRAQLAECLIPSSDMGLDTDSSRLYSIAQNLMEPFKVRADNKKTSRQLNNELHFNQLGDTKIGNSSAHVNQQFDNVREYSNQTDVNCDAANLEQQYRDCYHIETLADRRPTGQSPYIEATQQNVTMMSDLNNNQTSFNEHQEHLNHQLQVQQQVISYGQTDGTSTLQVRPIIQPTDNRSSSYYHCGESNIAPETPSNTANYQQSLLVDCNSITTQWQLSFANQTDSSSLFEANTDINYQPQVHMIDQRLNQNQHQHPPTGVSYGRDGFYPTPNGAEYINPVCYALGNLDSSGNSNIQSNCQHLASCGVNLERNQMNHLCDSSNAI